MKNRFNTHNISNEDLMPMTDYFNNLEDKKFLMVIEYLSKGWGFALKNNYSCTFENDGVKFINANGKEGKSVSIDYEEFYKYLKVVCEEHLIRYKKDESNINTYLSNFREIFI